VTFTSKDEKKHFMRSGDLQLKSSLMIKLTGALFLRVQLSALGKIAVALSIF
jgi:hypothetical protein